MKRLLPFLLFAIAFQTVLAQEQHAWVYLTDKENVSQALANPITIMTQKAIDRKNAHGVAIDARDVPVNESYITTLKQQTGITVLAKSKWFNCVHITGTLTDIGALTSLAFVDSIDYADDTLDGFSRSAEAQLHNQHQDKLEVLVDFNYGSATAQAEQINAHKLHELDYTGSGMTIAVMDSGFPNVSTMGAFQRMRDNGNLLGGYNFPDRSTDYTSPSLHNHGTLVLSDMAGYIENQFVGTAPDASYYLFRTENASSETPVEESYWVEAAERADSLGVDVINTSLGYNTFDDARYDYATTDMDGNTAFITKGANIAFEKGMLVVNSAGNSGNAAWGIITAPADAAGAFTVGAVTATGAYASFSSRGPTADGRVKPDTMARGSTASVINQGNSVSSASGTSFSSPIMAGALTCLWQALPDLTNAELMQLVREVGSTFATPTIQMGYGIPDLEQALNNALSSPQFNEQQFLVSPNPVTNFFDIRFPSGVNSVQLSMYTILGKQVISKEVNSADNRVDTSHLNTGVYLVQLLSSQGKQTYKLIKQ